MAFRPRFMVAHGFDMPLPGASQALDPLHPLAKGLTVALLGRNFSDSNAIKELARRRTVQYLLSAGANVITQTGVSPRGPALEWSNSTIATGARLSIPSDQMLDMVLSPSFSVAFWVYQNPGGGASFHNLLQFASAGSPTNGWVCDIVVGSSAIEFEMAFATSAMDVISATNSFKAGQWNHVVIVYPENTLTAANVQIYINGQLTTHGTNTDGVGARSSEAGQALTFGGDPGGTGSTNFCGYLESVFVYNRVLSSSDALWLFDESYAMFKPSFGRRRFFAPATSVVNTTTLIATQAQASLQTRQVGAIRLATQAETAAVQKSVNAGRIATQAESALVTKQVGAIRVATQAQSALQTRTSIRASALLAAQATSALLTRQVNAIRIAAQAQSSSLVKRVAATRIATQAQSALRVVQVNVVRVATQATADVLAKSVGKILVATQAQTALESAQKVALKTLLAAQATADVLTKQVNAIRIATQSTADVLTKQVQAIRLATQGQATTLVRQVGKALTAVQSQTAQQIRQLSLVRIATQAQAALLSAQRVSTPILTTLIAAQAQAASMVRQVSAVRIATQAQALAMSRATLAVRIAAQATSATTARLVRVVRLASQAQAAAVVKAMQLSARIATQSQTATLSALRVFLRSLTATQAQAASMARQIGVARVAAQAQSASMLRAIGKLLPTSQAVAVTQTRRSAVTRIATQSVTASIGRTIGRVFRAVQGTLAAIASQFTHGQPRVLSFISSRAVSLSLTSAPAVVLPFSTSNATSFKTGAFNVAVFDPRVFETTTTGLTATSADVVKALTGSRSTTFALTSSEAA